MDGRWIENAPALAYVKELDAWIVVNNNSEMISWTDDPAEIDWLSTWVLGHGADKKAKMRVSNPKPKVIKPICNPQSNANPGVILPMRRP
jgi:hypothetical protein